MQQGADIAVTFSDGDQFGALAREDGTVEVYRNNMLLATRDVTGWPDYANAGYIGLWFTGASDATLDDLGGGTAQMPLTAAFSASPVTGAVPLTVTFTNQSTPASTITGYLWAFGDGYTATITSPVHSYTSVGYYTVTLAALAGAEHNTITKTNYITVSATSAPTAAFTASPVTGTVPLTVTFTNQSSPTQTLTSYLWAFGDGSTSAITNPEHTYTATGYYTVALTAYAGAAQDTITKTNYITATSGGSAATLLTTTIGYTYDPLQRLTGATASGATTYTFAYAYDAVGNRTAQTQTITSTLVTNYVYDAANRLTSVNGQAYTWDNNGNLTNDGSKVYTYTQANRLIIVTASGLTWSAAYNGDGARLRTTVNSVPTTYTQDLAAPLPVVLRAKTGVTTTQYLFDMGTRPLAEYHTGWDYLLPDGLGSVRQLADGSGSVGLAQSYDPYGSRLNTQGSASSIFGFTGEQTDGTGLVFLRARYMQPTVGVFLSRDPWQGYEQGPGTYNGFNYAMGNPINLSDPSGLMPPYPSGQLGPFFFAMCFSLHTGSQIIGEPGYLGMTAQQAVDKCKAAYNPVFWDKDFYDFDLGQELPKTAYDLFGWYVHEWRGKYNSDRLFFDAKEPLTQELARSSLINNIRNWHLDGWIPDGTLQDYKFGAYENMLAVLVDSHAHPDKRSLSLQFYLGSFWYQVKYLDGYQRVGFRIDNDTTRSSGSHIAFRFDPDFYGSVEELISPARRPDLANKPLSEIFRRNPVISILQNRPRAETNGSGGGNLYQTFTWTENYDCSLYRLILPWQVQVNRLDYQIWSDFRKYTTDPPDFPPE